MATPLLRGVATCCDEVHAWSEAPVTDLLEGSLPLIKFHKIGQLANLLEFAKLVRDIRSHRIGTILVVNRSFRAALCARLAGSKKRVGHATEGRNFLLTQTVPYDADKYEADCYMDLATTAGFAIESALPSLGVPKALREQMALQIPPHSIACQPGARSIDKQVPIKTMASVISSLQASGHDIVLVGGPEEQADGEELSGLLSRPVVNIIGKCSIKEIAALLANMRLTIGSDTGMMHVASAVGCPTVTVFGPMSSRKWGRPDEPHQIVQASGAKTSNVSSDEILAACRRILTT